MGQVGDDENMSTLTKLGINLLLTFFGNINHLPIRVASINFSRHLSSAERFGERIGLQYVLRAIPAVITLLLSLDIVGGLWEILYGLYVSLKELIWYPWMAWLSTTDSGLLLLDKLLNRRKSIPDEDKLTLRQARSPPARCSCCGAVAVGLATRPNQARRKDAFLTGCVHPTQARHATVAALVLFPWRLAYLAFLFLCNILSVVSRALSLITLDQNYVRQHAQQVRRTSASM